MGKFVEINLTETFEIPHEWEIVEDDEGNMAIQINENEYLDFETTILHANIKELGKEEEVVWNACVDDESFDILEKKGLNIINSELDIFSLDKDEVDFEENK